jgi:hypothetical protein
MPAFDDPGINRREVNLSELPEVRIRMLQHMEDGPALIGDALQWNNMDSVNHRASST